MSTDSETPRSCWCVLVSERPLTKNTRSANSLDSGKCMGSAGAGAAVRSRAQLPAAASSISRVTQGLPPRRDLNGWRSTASAAARRGCT
eukprot:SAG11_NODE_900_length_6632_cov_2.693403_2_plen_89_part_00